MNFTDYNEAVLAELERLRFPDLVDHVITEGNLTAENVATVIAEMSVTCFTAKMPPEDAAKAIHGGLLDTMVSYSNKETKH